MGTPVDVRLLCGSWLRSRQEDSEGEEVYRPAGATPARRERSPSGYQFNPDGTVRSVGAGTTDVPAVTTGVWQVDEDNPDRVRLDVGGRRHVLEIADLTPDRLVIRRTPSAGGS